MKWVIASFQRPLSRGNMDHLCCITELFQQNYVSWVLQAFRDWEHVWSLQEVILDKFFLKEKAAACSPIKLSSIFQKLLPISKILKRGRENERPERSLRYYESFWNIILMIGQELLITLIFKNECFFCSSTHIDFTQLGWETFRKPF